MASVADPLHNLIRRAQLFRNVLAKASADTGFQCRGKKAAAGSVWQAELRSAKNEEVLQQQDMLLAERLLAGSDILDGLLEDHSSYGLIQEQGEEEEEEEGDEHEQVTKGLDLELMMFEQERPGDVAEEALLQELFFPSSDEAKMPLGEEQEGAVDAADTRPDSFNLHPSKPRQSNTISLTVTVGKLIFCQPLKGIVSEQDMLLPRHMHNSASSSRCLLTLTFPYVSVSESNVGSCPEQCISVMPMKVSRDELHFEHQSQLFWKLPSGQLHPDIWKSRMMKATIEIGMHEGKTLQGNAYLSLHNVIRSMPSTLHSNLVMVGVESHMEKCAVTNSCNPGSIKLGQEQSPFSKNNLKVKGSLMRREWTGQKPLAILEVGLRLLPGSHNDHIQNLSLYSEEPWLYVYIHNGDYASKLSKLSTLEKRSTFFTLVIKSGSHSTFRFIHVDVTNQKQDLAGAILRASRGPKKEFIFIEIWQKGTDFSSWISDGLENLCGLVKVPLSTGKVEQIGPYNLIADGTFSLWHPQSDIGGKRMEITVFSGPKSLMLKVQEQTRSIVIIQRYVRGMIQRAQKLKSGLKNNLQVSDCDGLSRHVFEVTVQRAKDLPVEGLSNTDHDDDYRGMYIKYIFPGEDEALFTSELDLQKTVVFGATAHHRITLTQGQQLIDYLRDLDEEFLGLRFELWSHSANTRNTNENKAKDNGKQIVISGDHVEAFEKRRERCIGSAILPMQELLGLLRKAVQNRLSWKVRRLFELPIKFQKWVCEHATTSKLTVRVTYDGVHLTSKDLLEGTIFDSQGFPGVDSQFAMKANLEVLILDLKDIKMMLASKKMIPYIRFSLFPCNQDLEYNFPPVTTPFAQGSKDCSSYLMKITVDAFVLKELWESCMSFEVWYRTQANEDWFGVGVAPTVMLISRKQGHY